MTRASPSRRCLLLAVLLGVAAASPAHAWRAAGWGGRGVAVGPRGGVAAWGHGAGVAYGPHGGVAAWNRGPYYYGRVYRPPAVYPAPVYRGGYYYGGYSGGAVAAAAVAGMAVGAMAGAAAASPSTTVVVQQPATVATTTAMPMGAQVTVLPGQCASTAVGNVQYYQCGPNWFRPYFGNASVYYQVVRAPY